MDSHSQSRNITRFKKLPLFLHEYIFNFLDTFTLLKVCQNRKRYISYFCANLKLHEENFILFYDTFANLLYWKKLDEKKNL
jgi:hypothetical protein